MNSMINSMLHDRSKSAPDLASMKDMRRLTYRGERGNLVDERPVIIDYDSGSTGRVQRIMKWADDHVFGQGGNKCCLRFEVSVIKPGRRSCHHEGDIVIWSQTFNDVVNNESIWEALHSNKVYAKEIRASLIRDGFPEEAKSF